MAQMQATGRTMPVGNSGLLTSPPPSAAPRRLRDVQALPGSGRGTPSRNRCRRVRHRCRPQHPRPPCAVCHGLPRRCERGDTARGPTRRRCLPCACTLCIAPRPRVPLRSVSRSSVFLPLGCARRLRGGPLGHHTVAPLVQFLPPPNAAFFGAIGGLLHDVAVSPVSYDAVSLGIRLLRLLPRLHRFQLCFPGVGVGAHGSPHCFHHWRRYPQLGQPNHLVVAICQRPQRLGGVRLVAPCRYHCLLLTSGSSELPRTYCP